MTPGVLTPGRFARIREIFEGALDRGAGERRAFIEHACAGDEGLLNELVGMLATEGQDGPVLARAHLAVRGSEEGRFWAGMVLAGRYRILGLLGRGGMGEVYRAHDLILNQTVALKFLSPESLSESALVRFRKEVRIARQVSHPNVCRVYDVGVVEELHFLSMEYIDGEDLASLLRRIGRLPQGTAIEFARKICAGLAAAHDRGVLHRDLKPSNIMIDGRGHPRITDFGLSELTREIPLADLRSGTPAYMSPEQKAGKEVTTRSDLYALGLVLHEMFTGRTRHASSTPSDLVKDLDPAIERVILRCLEEDPRRRPASALGVAMALPGGDPIAAALAAGETPSPEIVAASQEIGGLSLRAAFLCLTGVVAAAALLALFSFNSRLLHIARLPIPPDGLAFRAQEVLKQLGYPDVPASVAYGWDCCDDSALRLANERAPVERDRMLASHRPPVIRFWYRQHRRLMFEPSGFPDASRPIEWAYAGIRYDSPANNEPGMTRLLLDGLGRLVAFELRPASGPATDARAVGETVWTPLFSAAGIDRARFALAAPQTLPPMPFDSAAAWIGTYAGDDRPVRVEAAAWQGRAVFFSVAAVNDEPGGAASRPPGAYFMVVFVIFLCGAAAAVAFHNLRTGRGDRRGALRIAAVGALFNITAWVLTANHVSSPWELALFFGNLGNTAVVVGMTCLAYLAVEPYVRRFWPESLISWNRLVAGKIHDPIVASHVLAGVAAWIVLLAISLPLWRLRPVLAPEQVMPLQGVGHLAATLLLTPVRSLGLVLGAMLIAVLARVVTGGRARIADPLACLVFGFSGPLDFSSWQLFAISAVLIFPMTYVINIWLLRRFGLLALFSAWTVRFLPSLFVAGTWHAGRGLFVHLIPVAIAVWATWTITINTRGEGLNSAISSR